MPDRFLDADDLFALESISHLHTLNPFEPAWEALQRQATYVSAYVPAGGASPAEGTLTREVWHLLENYTIRLGRAGYYLSTGATGTAPELATYQRAALYRLWEDFAPLLQKIIDQDAVDVPFYDSFVQSHRSYFGYPGLTPPEPAHLLAVYYQALRAWYFPATKILGRSPSAVAARVALWQANLGGDLCAYVDSLYRHMDEIPVLITGETGTGKELAAECIGWSRYIPFDPGTRHFARRYGEDFHVRNLCEVPADLLPSALFGHKRGAFTGATADAPGYFALAGQHGTLFLDEAGEIPEHVQAKLLRPFQNREYVPVGELRPRKIQGRLLFATHRDLEALCKEGKFRPDLHERMNGFHVHMPSLRQMLAEAPGELVRYVRAFVAGKLEGPEHVERWTERVTSSIRATRSDYLWTRNLRELKNYTERYVLTNGRVTEPTPVGRTPAAVIPAMVTTPLPAEGTAGTPESTCLPSSGILGPKAKKGEATLEEVNRSLATRVLVLTGQNKAETRAAVGDRLADGGRLIDPAAPGALAEGVEVGDRRRGDGAGARSASRAVSGASAFRSPRPAGRSPSPQRRRSSACRRSGCAPTASPRTPWSTASAPSRAPSNPEAGSGGARPRRRGSLRATRHAEARTGSSAASRGCSSSAGRATRRPPRPARPARASIPPSARAVGSGWRRRWRP